MKMASRSELFAGSFKLLFAIKFEHWIAVHRAWLLDMENHCSRKAKRHTVFCSELVTCRPCSGRWQSTAKKIMNMEVWKQKRLLFRKKKWFSFQGVDQWRRLQIPTSMNLSLTWQTSSWHNLEVSRLSQSWLASDCWLASDRMLVCNLMVSHYPIACLFIKHVFLLKSFE